MIRAPAKRLIQQCSPRAAGSAWSSQVQQQPLACPQTLARPFSVSAAAAPHGRRQLLSQGQGHRFLSTTGDKDDAEPEVVEAELVDDDAGEEEDTAVPPPEPEKSGTTETHEFMAETRQLLDIVTNSIYTDKDVFLRELVSNASDALEKLRHTQVMGEEIQDPALPLEIRIFVNEAAGTITLQDTGYGMTRWEQSSSYVYYFVLLFYVPSTNNTKLYDCLFLCTQGRDGS
jgi:hypothetical protein